jgi:6-phosphogluconolactonase
MVHHSSLLGRFTAWIVLPVCVLALGADCACAAGPFMVYVGTNQPPASKGIYACRFDPETGKLDAATVAAETPRPDFLALSPDKKFLYATGVDRNVNVVCAFAVDSQTGKLTPLNKVSSSGQNPAHVSVDRTGKNVLVANYGSGSVAVLPVKADGSLGEASDTIQFSGKSVDPSRQQGPHSHSISVSPDNRFVFVADLGQDKLFVYRFDAEKGKLTPNDPPFAAIHPGAGPRHFAFGPGARFLYVISEMASTITAFAFTPDTGSLKELQTVSTLPKDFTGRSTTAEIVVHPSGKFLYGSNRGHDSIAVFAIDPAAGTLTAVGQVPTGGRTPRNFAIDPTGNWLIAANQDSNSLVLFRIDLTTGTLKPSGVTIEVPSPCCVDFASLK